MAITPNKLMKKLLLTLAVLTASMAAMAQHREGDFLVQPKVGLNISTLSDADKTIGDANFGIEAEYMATDLFSVSGGIMVSNQGGKYDDDLYGSYTVDLDYANVPIMANLYVLPGLAIKAGAQLGFRMKAKVKLDNTTFDMDEFYARSVGLGLGDELKVNKFDLSIPVGISYEYKNAVIEARYAWGLSKIMNYGDPFYNRVIQLTLGYKFSMDL